MVARHGIEHGARAASLTYDKLGTVHLHDLAEKFQDGIGYQLYLKLGPDTTFAQLSVHVMSWHSRRFVFWVDESDFDLDSVNDFSGSRAHHPRGFELLVRKDATHYR